MITLLLFVPPVMLAGCYAAWRIYRSLAAGAAALIGVMVWNAITVEPAQMNMAGFHIYAEDLVGLALAGAAVLRLAPNPGALQRLRAWWGFGAAIVLAFALGAALNGLKAAGVEFRQFFYFAAAIAYTASFPLNAQTLKELVRVWLAGCAALLALALFRWTAGMLHLGIAGTWATVGAGQPLRVLNAAHALFLAQGLLVLIYYSRRGTWHVFLYALAGAVVLLQHRSVWVALLVSAGVLCYRERMFRPFIAAASVLIIAAGVTVVAAPERVTMENEVARSLVASVEEPFDLDRSSFGWRLLMWQEYVREFLELSPIRKVTGVGFGNPGAYEVADGESAVSAHNIYIYTLNRSGVLGLATLLLGYAALWRRVRIPARILHAVPWNPSNLLFAILAGQLTYFTVYSPAADQGLLTGAMTAIPALWCRFEAGPAEVKEEEEAAVAAGVA